jgi:hypothetical protein
VLFAHTLLVIWRLCHRGGGREGEKEGESARSRARDIYGATEREKGRENEPWEAYTSVKRDLH